MVILRHQSIAVFLAMALFIASSSMNLAQQRSNTPPPPPNANDSATRTTSPSTSGSPETPPRSANRTTRSTSRDTYVRLARAPNMFGDSLRTFGNLRVQDFTFGPVNVDTLFSGASSYNVAENNRALPTDRAYFVYNGFYNAINFAGAGTTSLQRYTLGLERTFMDGMWSIDLRMPFHSGFEFTSVPVSTDSGNVGNLSVFLKGLLWREESWAISAGGGIGLPTGSDIVTRTPGINVEIQNESVHLMPFIALTAAPNDAWFLQAFSQIDFAASGSDVLVQQNRVGTFNEQNLLHADIAVGRWLARDLGRPYLYGVASVLELHYATSLQDSDAVIFARNFGTGNLNVPGNRTDFLNLTSGLHFQLTALSNFRVGVVAPLRTAPDRSFSSELNVSFNRLF